MTETPWSHVALILRLNNIDGLESAAHSHLVGRTFLCPHGNETVRVNVSYVHSSLYQNCFVKLVLKKKSACSFVFVGRFDLKLFIASIEMATRDRGPRKSAVRLIKTGR
jgi:hypothetical protein